MRRTTRRHKNQTQLARKLCEGSGSETCESSDIASFFGGGRIRLWIVKGIEKENWSVPAYTFFNCSGGVDQHQIVMGAKFKFN